MKEASKEIVERRIAGKREGVNVTKKGVGSCEKLQ